jgi:hypothetical protein
MITTREELDCAAVDADTPPLRVVVFYENREAELHAKTVLRHVAAKFQGELPFLITEWSLDLLSFPAMQRMAMQEAGHADLVVLAVDNEEFFSDEVIDCITGWRCDKSHHAALMFLWDNHGEHPQGMPSVYSHLREVARDKNMTFLGDGPEWAEENLDTELRRFKVSASHGPSSESPLQPAET